MTTEQDYLEMADHCKKVVQEKDTMIKHLKHKNIEVQNELRDLEYTLSNIQYLLKYKESENNTKNKHFIHILRDTMESCRSMVDNARDLLTDDDDEENVILMLNLMDE